MSDQRKTVEQWAKDARDDIIAPMHVIERVYVNNTECPNNVSILMRGLARGTLAPDEVRDALRNLKNSPQ